MVLSTRTKSVVDCIDEKLGAKACQLRILKVEITLGKDKTFFRLKVSTRS